MSTANVFAVVRWCLSLGAKLYRVVPILTLAIVCLTLVSQISSILSFFLPLKIVILLGSEGVPGYLPSILASLDRDILILALSVATIGFFLLSVFAEKLIERATNVAVGKLLAKSQKMVLFENQDLVAADGYRRYSSALAGVVFVPLAVLVLGWFYFPMAGLITGYLVFWFLFFLGFCHVHEGAIRYLDQKLPSVLSLLANMGFFLVFGYLVVESIFFSPPGFIVAVISLIASRQIFGRAAATVNSVVGLAKRRPKLDVLFFHGKVFVEQPSGQGEKTVWSLLAAQDRKQWLFGILKEAGYEVVDAEKLQVSWLESSQVNMPHLLVSDARRPHNCFLVKLFDLNRKSFSQHELSLAMERPDGLPMPELVLVTEVFQFPCQVYRLPPGQVLKAKLADPKVPTINAKFFSVQPPATLVNRYLRSRPLLGDRLSSQLLERLCVACRDRTDALHVNEVVQRLPEIQFFLRSLPVVLLNSGVKGSIWMSDDDKSLLVLNWDKWSLDPLGSGWPLAGDVLERHLAAASKNNSALSNVEVRAAELAAMLSEVERLLIRQQFLSVLDILPKVLRNLNVLKNSPKE